MNTFLYTFPIIYGYVIVKRKIKSSFTTWTVPFYKTHIPILTKRTTRVNSIIKAFHLITKKGTHTIGMGCHITTQSVFDYFARISCITDMTTIILLEVLPFFGVTASIRPTPWVKLRSINIRLYRWRAREV